MGIYINVYFRVVEHVEMLKEETPLEHIWCLIKIVSLWRFNRLLIAKKQKFEKEGRAYLYINNETLPQNKEIEDLDKPIKSSSK